MRRARIECLNNLPINTVYCVGRNYAAHAKELKNDVPEEPLIFLKSNSCISESPNSISLPSYSSEVHHEVELVIAISQDGYQIPLGECLHHIGALAVGIDLTARDIQNQLKSKGKPWTKAKSFKDAAILSEWESYDVTRHPLSALQLELSVNKVIRQSGNTHDMLFSIEQIIQYLSMQFPLYAGDIIYTGTPAGVSVLYSGDVVQAKLSNTDCRLSFSVN